MVRGIAAKLRQSRNLQEFFILEPLECKPQEGDFFVGSCRLHVGSINTNAVCEYNNSIAISRNSGRACPCGEFAMPCNGLQGNGAGFAVRHYRRYNDSGPKGVDMNRTKTIAGWAGMIGSALFITVFMVEGWLRPGYDWLSTFISELSIGPRGWIQIFNFIILGTLFLVFTRGVAAEFREGKASKWGPILLAIIGISFLVSGPLVTDVAGTPRDQMTPQGTLHGIFGALVFSLAPVSCFVFWRRFREDPDWKHLRGWTLAAGLITMVAVILLSIATKM